MIFDKDTAFFTAKKLWDIQAVRLEPEQPFTWASGMISPIYCDNRLALSYPAFRDYIAEQTAAAIRKHFPDTEVIAGVATGAIAWGALIAQKLDLPMVYVRSQAKSHGRKNRIEGHLPAGARVCVAEDLVSTGMSSMQAVQALQEQDAHITGMTAIFTYGLPKAVKLFEEKKIRLFHLSNYDTLIEVLQKENKLSDEQVALLNRWKTHPETWRSSSL